MPKPAKSIPAGTEFVSCPYIESALVFALGNLCLCCITNHGKGYPMVGEYHGEELPLDRILVFRETVRTMNQKAQRHPLCAGCGYLEKRRWERQSYPFAQLIIAHFLECNLRCRYCYILKHGHLGKPYQPYDLYPVLQSMLQREYLSPRGQVSWGGGEPVLFQDFEGLFRLLLDYGVHQDVNTNGTLISPVLKEGLLRGRASLTCGVDAGTAKTYQRLKGRDYFERVWRNLEEYAKTGGRVAAKMIVMQENHHEVVPFLRRAKEAGVRNILYDVNFFDQEQSEEIVEAIALLIKEGTEDPELRVSEGGGGIASFGEALRARIRGNMDKVVTWGELVEKRRRIEGLESDVKNLKEQIEHLEQSRAIRLSRGFRKNFPLLMGAARRGYGWLGRVRKGTDRVREAVTGRRRGNGQAGLSRP